MRKYILGLMMIVLILSNVVLPVRGNEIIYGDLDWDEKVTASDALEILKSVVGKASLFDDQYESADVDGSGTVDATDALFVLKKVVGKIKRFPVEEDGYRIEISADNFPDITFRNAIRQMVQKDYITLPEINEIKILDVKGYEIIEGIRYSRTITDLTGIEYFTALEELDCSENELTELDLRKNKALKKLNCAYNQIEQPDVSENVALEELYCDGNPIVSLDVCNLAVLKLLGIEETKIKQLNVKNNPLLQFVWHDETDLGSWQPNVQIDAVNFPDEVFREDVKGMDADKNDILTIDEIMQVTTFDFYPVDLQGQLFREPITCAKGIQFFTSLEYINCIRNRLTEIDLSRNTKLKSLQIQENDLQYLNVNRNGLLEYLYVDGNQKLCELDITRNAKLKRLTCESTGVDTLDIRNNPNLEELKGDDQMDIVS